MSMARRLAHRARAVSASATSARTTSAGTTGTTPSSSSSEGARHRGFVCERWTVPTDSRQRRGRGTDPRQDPELSAIELPRAAALARALAELVEPPPGGFNPTRPAVMLDLETTGLLGQADALVCVVGLAWHGAADRIEVAQWSLHRVASEAALLADVDACLAELLGPGTAIVSFNGASFDVPVLRRRMVRHGLYPPTETPLRAPHVDLLPPSRRLWRDRGPDCRLGTLEQRHLALHRDGDVGGYEVVELLWRWLEEPSEASADDLARVERHNRIDVLSLATLAQTLCDRLREPTDDVESLRAARHYARIGRAQSAHARLVPLLDRLAGARGGAGLGSELPVEAGLFAAELHRKHGQADHAARLWAQICRRVPGHSLAHEALAKHLEHRRRDLAAALSVAAASVTPCDRRMERLTRRLSGRRSQDQAIPPVASVIDTIAAPEV